MTRLILLRHGETDWNREGRFQGQADPPLNTTGREQAKASIKKLAGWSFEAIYSSDLQRAVETAQIIARRHGLSVRQDRRLREINQGEWEGLLAEEIASQYPQAWAARQRDPVQTWPPGGETPAEVAVRVWAAADDIVRACPSGPVLIVSHAVALATLLVRARRLSLNQVYELAPENGRIEEIDWVPR
jgi:broad specificity phosphatase PhoE